MLSFKKRNYKKILNLPTSHDIMLPYGSPRRIVESSVVEPSGMAAVCRLFQPIIIGVRPREAVFGRVLKFFSRKIEKSC